MQDQLLLLWYASDSLRFIHNNSLETVFFPRFFFLFISFSNGNHKLKMWQISMSWCQFALSTSPQTLPTPMNTDVTNCFNGPNAVIWMLHCAYSITLTAITRLYASNKMRSSDFFFFFFERINDTICHFSTEFHFVSIGNKIVQQTTGMCLECFSVCLSDVV